MEALTAVSVAALTIYDMVKAVDRGMIIGDIRLIEKAGGKTGTWKGLNNGELRTKNEEDSRTTGRATTRRRR